LSIDELSAMLTRHEVVAIYDTNSQERYAQGHVPTARWVAHDGVTAEVLPQDRDTRLVFYCANEH
jgi:rhodanese-related sulfurtransferase